MLIAARSSKDFACCLRATASARCLKFQQPQLPRSEARMEKNLKSSQRASRRVEADADLARGADFSVERGKAHN